jgi:V8-like Glu-specific endopeptidase
MNGMRRSLELDDTLDNANSVAAALANELPYRRPAILDKEHAMASNNGNRITGSGPETRGKDHEKAVADYWTPERMATAIPVPMPKAPKGEASVAAARPEGEPGSTPPGDYKDEGSGQHGASQAAPRAAGGNPVVNPRANPYTTCGKLFFTQGGQNFSGSAAVVAPNVLLTAGHCVFKGGWSSNVAFYPSYPKRAVGDPAYRFTYSYEAAWTAWTQNSNRAYDYGFVWIDSAPGNRLGWLGLLWNAGRTWDAVGYPATPNPPFNGNAMDEALGSVASSSLSGTIGLTNDNMEHGSSGGPWITNFNGSARVYANGLQSFHVHDGGRKIRAKLGEADVKSLLDWISNPANRH